MPCLIQNNPYFLDTNSTIRPIVRPCRVNKELPTNDMYQCKEPDVVFQQWSALLPFKHNDRQVLYFYIYIIQVWTQKCAVQKASVDVNISYY